MVAALMVAACNRLTDCMTCLPACPAGLPAHSQSVQVRRSPACLPACLPTCSTFLAPLQLGHFFGLPHPFPDGRQTCRLDGDGIRDTPQTFAPNHGCEQEGDMHVCPDSEDGVLPALNFMDFTNDTCRWVVRAGIYVLVVYLVLGGGVRVLAAWWCSVGECARVSAGSVFLCGCFGGAYLQGLCGVAVLRCCGDRLLHCSSVVPQCNVALVCALTTALP
jgi:hypothetical protein